MRFSRWLAVVIGFSGILLMLSANLSAGSTFLSSGFALDGAALGSVFALLAAMCSATSNVQIRFFKRCGITGRDCLLFLTDDHLYWHRATLAFGWTMPKGREWWLLIGCGFFGGVAQILVTLSLRYADASLLAPFDYTTLVWSMDWLSVWTVCGHATLVGGIDCGAGGDFHHLVRPASAQRADDAVILSLAG